MAMQRKKAFIWAQNLVFSLNPTNLGRVPIYGKYCIKQGLYVSFFGQTCQWSNTPYLRLNGIGLKGICQFSVVGQALDLVLAPQFSNGLHIVLESVLFNTGYF